ncbi:MAG TPA: DUF192 domain-containing protein [Candidatus Paceibacterota bacterium]|nr:DUF192 domain-containing protein [Candidatus Paceibacterota bacterium]
MKLWWWIGGVVLLVVAFFAFELMHVGTTAAPISTALPQTSLTIDGVSIVADVATTPAQQELGLGGRSRLAPGTGMLFVFPQDGHYAFWMKDMHFSIDIIWLASDGTVVFIVPNLSPATYPQSYGPKGLARYVLEVPAGFATQNHLQVGDRAQLPASF